MDNRHMVSQIRHIPAKISDLTSAADPRPQRATLIAWLSMTSTICRSSSAGLRILREGVFDLTRSGYRKCHQETFKTQSTRNLHYHLIIQKMKQENQQGSMLFDMGLLLRPLYIWERWCNFPSSYIGIYQTIGQRDHEMHLPGWNNHR